MFSNVRIVHTIQYKQSTTKILIFWKKQEPPVVNCPFLHFVMFRGEETGQGRSLASEVFSFVL